MVGEKEQNLWNGENSQTFESNADLISDNVSVVLMRTSLQI